jgi:hypothetical protein
MYYAYGHGFEIWIQIFYSKLFNAVGFDLISCPVSDLDIYFDPRSFRNGLKFICDSGMICMPLIPTSVVSNPLCSKLIDNRCSTLVECKRLGYNAFLIMGSLQI